MFQTAAIWLSAVLLVPAIAVLYLACKRRPCKLVTAKPQISPDEFTEFKLLSKEPVTHNTHLYRFALPDPKRPLGLQPGQHIQIRAAVDDTSVIKPYTPVSLSTALGHFDLLIKTYPAGRISKYMHDQVQVGHGVAMRGPKGTFRFRPNLAPRLGMIAGGTGITPLLSVARAVLENPEDRTCITLLFANRTAEDILLEKELDELASEFPAQFQVHYTVDTPDEKWDGLVGLVKKEMIEGVLPGPSEGCRLLICGPPPMMVMVVEELQELGFPAPTADPDSQVFRF